MSRPPAGSSKKTMFSQDDYLAPLPLPTGQKPSDCLNIIWRKNDTFLDISHYSIGSAVALAWFQITFFLALTFTLNHFAPLAVWPMLLLGSVMVGMFILFLILILTRPAPLPMRFNRQRREVCYLHKNGAYWIVPWESVIATASQVSSTSQGGRITQGVLIISLENPDPEACDNTPDVTLSFNCGGGETAMALWECVRTYMEVGPDAITDNTSRFTRTKGILASYLDDLRDAAKRKGWFMTLLWDGFFGVFVFNTLLADLLERKKLYPLPDLDHPDIIEWSKPLPPEQWAKPSAELQAAFARLQAAADPARPAL
ncbi:DUF6708 domain-containing protein [Pseudomonas ovata]|uniref:DUF6708 domain-containing protein n=1 Tax=Pseudomonas ovata TaxID=1839709 RepID=UPI000D6945B0|nr:DUF6708 domain-containing protein [Pseudomonas ovata]